MNVSDADSFLLNESGSQRHCREGENLSGLLVMIASKEPGCLLARA
jgi:hypothetical protein